MVSIRRFLLLLGATLVIILAIRLGVTNATQVTPLPLPKPTSVQDDYILLKNRWLWLNPGPGEITTTSDRICVGVRPQTLWYYGPQTTENDFEADIISRFKLIVDEQTISIIKEDISIDLGGAIVINLKSGSRVMLPDAMVFCPRLKLASDPHAAHVQIDLEYGGISYTWAFHVDSNVNHERLLLF
jgi:hypothetical protein